MIEDNTALVPIPVPRTGRALNAAVIDGRPHVSLRHACEAIGVNYSTQLDKLRRRSWASVPLWGTQLPNDTQRREYAMIDRRTLVMWLATIDETRVSDEARPILVAFQAEAADALDSYFGTGVAVATQMTQFDILRQAIDGLEAAQRTAEEAKQIAERSEARLDGIEGRHDWFSALGYAKAKGLPTYTKFTQRLGKCAAMIARTHDIAPDPVQHAHYGTVNSFPAWIWDMAADGLGGVA